MKSFLSLFLIMLLAVGAYAQVPNLINYQAVVRNSTGVVVQNQMVGVKVTILAGSTSGPAVFSETHAPTTNTYGLINIKIGAGTNFGPQLSSIVWSADDYFMKVEIDPFGGTSYSITTTSQLISVPYALHAKTVEQNDDADADPGNEYNNMGQLNGTDLEITDGGGTITVDLSSLEDDADPDPTNEIQTINKFGNIITLSLGGGAVTDEVNDADANPANELNTGFNLVGTTLSITDAGGTQSVNLSTVAGDPNTTNELNTSATLVGSTLNITDPGGTLSVNLSALGNDADANPANELNSSATLVGSTLNITDAGGTISVSLAALGNDADANPTNEIQTLSLVGNNLTISSGNTVALPANTDGQTLSLVGSNLTISGGNSVTLPADSDGQTLTLVGSNLTISGGNTVTLGGGTDSQTLTLVGSDLSISNGNTITLPSGGTDSQTLSIIGNNITISGGNTIAIPADTDDQTLSLSGADLTIAGGNTVTLPLQTHFIGEHFGGGIVVWVDSTGQHGLIAATANVGGTTIFENTPNSLTVVASSFTNGQANTTALVAVVGEYPAAMACDAYAGGGFTDWYLPAAYELELLAMSNYVMGTSAMTAVNYYWSSTQDSGSAGFNAYRVRNVNFDLSSNSDSNLYLVRPMRKF